MTSAPDLALVPGRHPANAVPAIPTGRVRPAALALFAMAACGILFLRYPGRLLHAEFIAEDGWFWYPQAYTFGWHALFWPLTGYLQTISRLVAWAAQSFPLAWGPTLFAAAALVVQAAPAVFLVSDRMAAAWPSLPGRLAFALLLLVLPNAYEVFVNLTNAQWHLAILAFLVLVSLPPRGPGGMAFDAIVLVLSGLSGPFCLFLMPVAAWEWLEHRDAAHLRRGLLLLAPTLAQAVLVLSGLHADRSAAPLGATPDLFARIIGMQVLLAPLLGARTMLTLQTLPAWRSGSLPALVCVTGFLIWGISLWRGPALLRKATLFAACIIGSALVAPQCSLTEPQWACLARPYVCERYHLFPMLAWLGALFALAADRDKGMRLLGLLPLLLLVRGIPADWSYPAFFQPTDFVRTARRFERAPPGTRMAFPIIPPGASMVLVKHGPPNGMK